MRSRATVQSPAGYDRQNLTGPQLAARFNAKRATELAAAIEPVVFVPSVVYDVTRYGADATGVDSSQDAFDTVNALAAGSAALGLHIEIVFPEGRYRYEDSPDWRIENTRLTARGRVWLLHEGVGRAWRYGADANTNHVVNCGMRGDFVISGTADTTDGLFIRHAQHAVFEVEVRNCTGNGARVQGLVLTRIALAVSVNRKDIDAVVDGMAHVPAAGINIAGTATVTETTDCLLDLIVEGVTTTGVLVGASCGNRFRGTSEGNDVRGIFMSSAARLNTFDTFFMEANDAGDVLCQGEGNEFNNCTASSTGGLSVEFDACKLNRWNGGLFNVMQFNANTSDNSALFFNSLDHVTDLGTRNWVYGRELAVSTDPRPAKIPMMEAFANVPALQTTWARINAGCFVPQVARNYSTGEVCLRGNVGGGLTGSTLFTLVAVHRPAAAVIVNCPAESGAGETARLLINTNGTVVHLGGNVTSFNLEQARWFV